MKKMIARKPTFTQAYIGFGSNLGNSIETLVQARKHLEETKGVSSLRSSGLYKTKPISSYPQDDYYNAVVECSVEMNALDFYKHLQRIEKLLGKVDKPKEMPRVLDLDILLFGEQVHESKELTIPHPRMLNRAFVLVPLLDLIPTGTVAFPTREGESMIQLRDQIKEVQKDSNQQVERVTGSIWDRQV